MGVSILGHRKTILKIIEDLRKNKRITLNLVASHESNKMAPYTEKEKSPFAPSEKSEGKNSESITKQIPTVHWSHLEPLSNNEVKEVFIIFALILFNFG